jgi:colanic acid/amylovoran biosynthesis glycosyltransferase
MRLVLIVPAFPKLSETFIVSKFLGLLEKGWDVHVACDTSDPPEWKKFPDLVNRPGIRERVHCGWPDRPRWLALLLLPILFVKSLLINRRGTVRYLKQRWPRFGFDTLRRFYLDANLLGLNPNVAHFEFGTLALGRMHLKEIIDCKVVVSFRGYDLNFAGLENPTHYQEVWDSADALHLLGDDLWRKAQRRGCPSDKVHALIPPAIDGQFFAPDDRRHTEATGTRERPLRILSVGRLEWIKGYEYAISAVRILREQGVNFEYRIVGDGGFLEAVAFARHQTGVEEAVHLLGARSRPDVRAEMLRADVFLHSAVSEGFCNAVLEAQSMVLPVVCSDAGGLAENVVNGDTGFVVPRRNPQAIAEKLILLASNPAVRQRMGLAGRQRVIACFQLIDQISAFDRLYRQVLRNDPGKKDTNSQNHRVCNLARPFAASL